MSSIRYRSPAHFHHDQRLLDQLRLQVDDVAGFDRTARTDRFSGLQRPAAREHREALEQLRARFVEQIVAPVDQRAQRLLARQRGAVAGRQQLEAVVQTLQRSSPTDSARARAAASSIASGMPSS